MNPSTFTYGPWLPDLANVGQPAAFGLTLGAVPAVDVLNVYYANGNYICMPSPVAAGPTLGSQIIGAYTWYDNSGGKEIVFAGLAGGISALIDGAWATLPFFNSQSQALPGWDLTSSWGAFQPLSGWDLTSSLGAVSGSTTGTFNATLVAGTFDSGFAVGYGAAGTLTPTVDQHSNTISSLYYAPTGGELVLIINAGSLGASYFTTLAFPSLSRSYASSAATYSSSGGQSQWIWTVPVGTGLTSGTSYPVTITT